MKKETKTRIIVNLSLALLAGALTLIALKCGKMNEAKKIKESPNNYDNLQESSSFDKVSSTTNENKLRALDEIYNYQNEKL